MDRTRMNQDQKSNRYIPHFYFGWKTVMLGLILLTGRYLFKRGLKYHNKIKLKTATIFKIYSLRKKWKLTKSVKFTDRFYSSPIVPSFPSPAFDHMVSNGGLNFTSYGTSQKRNIDQAFLAITNRCPLRCQHCYEKHNLQEKETMSVIILTDLIRKIQNLGVNTIILTGGEPMLRFDDLLILLRTADLTRTEFHIHTSGYGMTIEKAQALKDAGLQAAAVGLDDMDPDRHDRLRGPESFKMAVHALTCLNEVGILTYVNLCATRELIRSNGLWTYYNLVKNLKVSMIQLLEPRPCGAFLSSEHEYLLNHNDCNILKDFYIKGNTARKYKSYPLIYYPHYLESPQNQGCLMAGLSHFYIDGSGNVTPCVFMPVSFGNILKDDFNTIWQKIRNAVPHPIYKPCASLLLNESIDMRKKTLPVLYESIAEEWNKIINMD
jgi:MoaA/NifB/PqqE/SkfB family radical SAM enzyme